MRRDEWARALATSRPAARALALAPSPPPCLTTLPAPSSPPASHPHRAVFLVLVVVKGLAWEFSAEVMAIVAVQLAMLVLTLTNKNGVLPVWKGLVALSLYPASLLLVYVLEAAGWD